MKQQNVDQDTTKTVTIGLTWRSFGYLGAILLWGMSMGLLLHPMLTYPAVVSWAILGSVMLLIALTAPLFSKK